MEAVMLLGGRSSRYDGQLALSPSGLLPSAITLTALLASFAMSARAVYPPPNDYIMSMGLNWSNGYQSAYNSKGEDTFRWFKDYDKPRKGISTSRLADGSSTTLFALTSNNDACNATKTNDSYRTKISTMHGQNGIIGFKSDSSEAIYGTSTTPTNQVPEDTTGSTKTLATWVVGSIGCPGINLTY
ncbi:hypothetical protein PGTUg99_034749 [Puccinia graminis f. sp. tritici]|uniref:Uncharacterized protein n=1 Tax=Puccinia graminis f. sp. tritici TaxID=56615 RepID=A0A5B0Q9E6_PUCGR|nr:hypothetical protein PGTUg99_034749 [Puccinia graminis f. sp. tritici]